MLYLSEEQAILLKELITSLPNQGEAETDLLRQIDRDLAFMERQKVPPLTDAQKQTLRDTLEHAVVHRMPSDLIDHHDGDWFVINGRGQTVWNFRSADRPAMEICRELGWMESYQNSSAHSIHRITEAVKRAAAVRPIKARAVERRR